MPESRQSYEAGSRGLGLRPPDELALSGWAMFRRLLPTPRTTSLHWRRESPPFRRRHDRLILRDCVCGCDPGGPGSALSGGGGGGGGEPVGFPRTPTRTCSPIPPGRRRATPARPAFGRGDSDGDDRDAAARWAGGEIGTLSPKWADSVLAAPETATSSIIGGPPVERVIARVRLVESSRDRLFEALARAVTRPLASDAPRRARHGPAGPGMGAALARCRALTLSSSTRRARGGPADREPPARRAEFLSLAREIRLHRSWPRDAPQRTPRRKFARQRQIAWPAETPRCSMRTARAQSGCSRLALSRRERQPQRRFGRGCRGPLLDACVRGAL